MSQVGTVETAEYDSIPLNWIVKPVQITAIMSDIGFEVTVDYVSDLK